jgi:hypothetical protein
LISEREGERERERERRAEGEGETRKGETDKRESLIIGGGGTAC